MSWTFNQRLGILSHDGHRIGSGYSGAGVGRNEPDLEGERNVGPIPKGRYKIGPAYSHRTKGPMTMQLTPVGHDARGRTHFLIHGDSVEHPGEASLGCIVLTAAYRKRISESGDTDLVVL